MINKGSGRITITASREPKKSIGHRSPWSVRKIPKQAGAFTEVSQKAVARPELWQKCFP